ncbi:MAG: MBL fold metallo-hydrolase [Bdellovibrionales bacterium]|nr:MBL fold metallo-hydrolase [Bdellovibrionales bacterium]
MSSTHVKSLEEISYGKWALPKDFQVQVIVNDDNLTYLAYHPESRQAIVVDPMQDDWEVLVRETDRLQGYTFLAVLDTHTHADHISCAAKLAKKLNCPLVMHANAVSPKVDLRVSNETHIPTAAGPLRLVPTPGHTRDSLFIQWGPFGFTGDTILHGDTGRDDLPTGNPAQHFESLLKIKELMTMNSILLPGHDAEGGRASVWSQQLELNSSLKQSREEFIRDAGAYVGPSPKLLKESLFYNFQ